MDFVGFFNFHEGNCQNSVVFLCECRFIGPDCLGCAKKIKSIEQSRQLTVDVIGSFFLCWCP